MQGAEVQLWEAVLAVDSERHPLKAPTGRQVSGAPTP